MTSTSFLSPGVGERHGDVVVLEESERLVERHREAASPPTAQTPSSTRPTIFFIILDLLNRVRILIVPAFRSGRALVGRGLEMLLHVREELAGQHLVERVVQRMEFADRVVEDALEHARRLAPLALLHQVVLREDEAVLEVEVAVGIERARRALGADTRAR